MAILVDNADEIVASLPDSGLARDIVRALDEFFLSTKQEGDGVELEPAERVQLLIELAAPNEIRFSINHGKTIRVGPIDDFDAFVEAIDYGEVIASDAKKRRLRLRVDVEEIRDERLIARGEQSLYEPMLLQKLDRGESLGSAFGNGSSLAGRSRLRQRDDSGGRHRLELNANSLDAGQTVEVTLGSNAFAAEVVGPGEDGRIKVRFSDLKQLSKALNRGLGARIKRAGEVVISVPGSKLRRVRLDPMDEFKQQRTWVDNTGKHKIEATYGGVVDEKVKLIKNNGKESLVPLARLSDQDQAFVERARVAIAASDNPFAEQADKGAERDLKAGFKKTKGIRSGSFARWSFEPEAYRVRERASRGVGYAGLDTPAALGGGNPEIVRLFVADDGSSAMAVTETRRRGESYEYVQRVDFIDNEVGVMADLPEKSEVLDALPEEGLLLLKSSEHGVDEDDRIYVHRLGEERTRPLVNWRPFSPDDFHKKLEQGWFLAEGRVATQSFAGPLIVWDRDTGEALHVLPLDLTAEVFVEPGRRLISIASTKRLEVIDVVEGRHVASFTHGAGFPVAVRMRPDMQEIALWCHDAIIVWDMTSGEPVSIINPPSLSSGDRTIDWMGDFILCGGRLLCDPHRYTMLWEYAGESEEKLRATVRGGRLWYAPRQGSPYIGSIPAPHPALVEVDRKLGSIKDALVIGPGDAFRIKVTTDQPELEAQIRKGVTANLEAAGYRLTEDPETELAVYDLEVFFQKMPKREFTVIDSNKPFARRRNFSKREIAPHLAAIVVTDGEQIVYGDSYRSVRQNVLWIGENETVEDAASRIEKPNLEWILNLEYPDLFTRRGQVLPSFTFGYSVLGPSGVVDEKVDDSL